MIVRKVFPMEDNFVLADSLDFSFKKYIPYHDRLLVIWLSLSKLDAS